LHTLNSSSRWIELCVNVGENASPRGLQFGGDGTIHPETILPASYSEV
jgi:hypothetical protein